MNTFDGKNHFTEAMNRIVSEWQDMDSLFLSSSIKLFTNSKSHWTKCVAISETESKLYLGTNLVISIKTIRPFDVNPETHLVVNYRYHDQDFSLLYNKFSNLGQAIFTATEQMILYFLRNQSFAYVAGNLPMTRIDPNEISYIASAAIMAKILEELFYNLKAKVPVGTLYKLFERCELKASSEIRASQSLMGL